MSHSVTQLNHNYSISTPSIKIQTKSSKQQSSQFRKTLLHIATSMSSNIWRDSGKSKAN